MTLIGVGIWRGRPDKTLANDARNHVWSIAFTDISNAYYNFLGASGIGQCRRVHPALREYTRLLTGALGPVACSAAELQFIYPPYGSNRTRVGVDSAPTGPEHVLVLINLRANKLSERKRRANVVSRVGVTFQQPTARQHKIFTFSFFRTRARSRSLSHMCDYFDPKVGIAAEQLRLLRW